MKLAIISHTEHYKTTNGKIVGWAPTVNEINHLLDVFDEIYHIAMLYDDVPPKSTMVYSSDKIKFIPIPSSGGKFISSKLKIIYNAPKTISIISNTLKKVECFQLRTPTGIGVYLILYFTLFVKKKGWFKYAGNWNQKNAPLGYAFQRFLLKKQNRKVTINGTWENQPKHCVTFENPCLTETDLQLGKIISKAKTLDEKINFCYVGRLETPKGVGRIIDAFKSLTKNEKKRIGEVHLVGDGKERTYFEAEAEKSNINFKFHGFLSRDAVFDVYKKSHFFLMPTSASEGFPKVIAEAMNYGCIPVVSNISSIGQYVENKKNGFILNKVTVDELKRVLEYILVNTKHLKSFSSQELNLVRRFSYNHYNNKIREEILIKAKS